MVKQHFNWVILLLAVGIVALISVQLYWVNNAFRLREQEFKHSAVTGLEKAARQIENDITCFEIFSKTYIKPGEGIYMLKHKWKDENFLSPDTMNLDTIDLNYLYSGKKDTSLYNFSNLMFNNPATAEVTVRFEYQFEDTLIFQVDQNYSPGFEKLTARNFRDRLTYKNPFMHTNMHRADSIVKVALSEQGIHEKFRLGIRDVDADSFIYLQEGAASAFTGSVLSARLLDNKYFSKPYELKLFFSNTTMLLLQSLWFVLLTSVLVILILVYAFWYFIRTIRKQKKLSEMKTDFINNMTHEFKTPVTNISLALETISERQQPASAPLNPFLNIIGEENNRLRENVERILQIAAVEKEDFDLQPEEVDMHALIQRVVKNFEMHSGQRGKIEENFSASEFTVYADETHLTNVLYNLIDNGIKYSQTCFHLIIRTYNEKNGLCVSVEDRGIGMSPEIRKRIFDKFYRGQSGNLHDVKGFGLGLSYVKSMVNAHRGRIDVQSEAGKGSRFDVFIPFKF
jgi:two-component system phosphate regulon sensor histidine kinase PhoR